jgi:carbamoyl-phosphate synthase small subunit
LPFGHHGSNHPVQDLATGRIEITAQNHNYAVAPDSSARGVVSHVNLNDGVIEGVAAPSERCFSVQYHPEAGPGPHDARYLFDRFETLLTNERWRASRCRAATTSHDHGDRLGPDRHRPGL